MRVLLALLFALFAAAAPVAWATELKGMRVWDEPDATRVVFDLSSATGHNLFTLENPARVVIDIGGVGSEGAQIATRRDPAGLVQRVRAGPRDNGSLRVVFDVSSTVSAKSFILEPNEEYGYRLMLDLRRAQPKAEVAAAPANIAPPPAAAPAPVMQLEEKPIVIAIDAGHGGEDPGARGKSGLLEKNVALALARKLSRLINATPGMKAVLTRDGDYYVGLRERVQTARKADADLFVSIHANAYKHEQTRGTAVYVLSPHGQTNEQARWLAHRENSADMVGGIEIQDKDQELAAVLIDLSQSATMEASFDVGSRILGAMGQVNALQKSAVQQAGFMVLKAPDIPSVLVETAFITNARDEQLLRDPDSQERMARSIVDGVRGYFQSYRPQQIAEGKAGPPRAVAVNYTRSGGTSAGGDGTH